MHAFEVTIGMEDSVAVLKDVIKEKKSNAFHDVDADSLVLWNADIPIPIDENLKEAVDKLDLVDEKALSPSTRLSDVFPHQPEDGHLHIVVKAPLTGEYEWLAVTKILMSYCLFVPLPAPTYINPTLIPGPFNSH